MPTHVLIVPNQHIADTEALEPEHDALVGAWYAPPARSPRQEGLSERGYRLVFNTGPRRAEHGPAPARAPARRPRYDLATRLEASQAAYLPETCENAARL